MWTLTREPDDSAKKHTLSLLDIGVRSTTLNQQITAEVAAVKAVRCFVALVPDALESDLASVSRLKNDGKMDLRTEFADLDEVDVSRRCSLKVNGGNHTVYLMRGYYNEFWKKVIDLSRAGTAEQIEMFRRWQPFFGHDFTGRHYLTDPLNNLKPHEVHVVKMADYLRECGSTFYNTVTGCSFNQFSRVLLSGTGNDKQSRIGAPNVQTE
ncbi:hypothetical protein HDE_03480 [Halotydeus destructor]|nr:hypothetical protein HDE_03480 [Halotydeus destructor]